MRVLRAAAVAAAAGLMFASAGAASAAPPVSNTSTHEHKFVENFQDTVPLCTVGGELYNIQTTSNIVEKETVFANGSVHSTFTSTGTVDSATPVDGTGPSYTGKVTIWGGYNQNGTKTSNGTFTFSVKLTGSDGTRVSTQEVEHFNTRPNGTVNEFAELSHCQ